MFKMNMGLLKCVENILEYTLTHVCIRIGTLSTDPIPTLYRLHPIIFLFLLFTLQVPYTYYIKDLLQNYHNYHNFRRTA